MAWVKIPPAHHPIFMKALPKDASIETIKMFGGIAATVNGNMFAGLFGRSAMIWLPEDERAEALELAGFAPFDPMGDGRKSDKIMLPAKFMKDVPELRKWIKRAFEAASKLPEKTKKKKAAKKKR